MSPTPRSNVWLYRTGLVAVLAVGMLAYFYAVSFNVWF